MIGYPDEDTVSKADAEAQRLSADLLLETSALGLVVRSADGKTKVETPTPVPARAAPWGAIFGPGPVRDDPVHPTFIGAAVGGAMGALLRRHGQGGHRRHLPRAGHWDAAARHVLVDLLVVEKVTPDRAIEATSAYGGEVLLTSLIEDAEHDLQEALGTKPEQNTGAASFTARIVPRSGSIRSPCWSPGGPPSGPDG